MSGAILLPAAARAATAWRNGGGVTREVMAWPPGADIASFQWRLSIAQIDAPGPFSRFEQVERLLVPLAGAIDLTIGAAAPVRLAEGSVPLRFNDEAPVFGAPVGGGAIALNAMARRGRCVSDMTAFGGGATLAPGDGALLVVATRPVRVVCCGHVWMLDRFDALYSASGVMEAGAATGSDCGYAVRFVGV